MEKNNKDLKALHVTGFWSGNYYYRSWLPAYAVNKTYNLGWMTSNDSIEGQGNNGKELVQKMHKADVVQFQRPNYEASIELMKAAKQLNKIVVFDDDDTFKIGEGIVPKDDEEQKLAEKIHATRIEGLRMAHGATCTTEFLAKEMREHTNKVQVLPNCIDPKRADVNYPNTTGKPRILILGSVISNEDWHIAKEAILAVADKVTFVGMGVPDLTRYHSYRDDLKFWRSLPDFEEHPFKVFGEYYDAIQELGVDMAIAPRADNYFNRCKSNLKFLEVSLFGIPFIGQGFDDGMSPYQVNPADQPYQTVVDHNPQAWVDALTYAIDNIEELKAKGLEAQKYVTEEYSAYKHAHKWVDFYKELTK